MLRKNPLDVNTVNLGDKADRNAFYDALISDGAPLVRKDRMQAFQAGLIDALGYVMDLTILLWSCLPTLIVRRR